VVYKVLKGVARFVPQNFNDTLALLLLIGLPVMWVAGSHFKLKLPGEIIGVTIAAFTLVVQFYFRKAPPNGEPPKS